MVDFPQKLPLCVWGREGLLRACFWFGVEAKEAVWSVWSEPSWRHSCANTAQLAQKTNIPPKTRVRESREIASYDLTNFKFVKHMQWPETKIKWICCNLLWKTREIISADYSPFWNQCVPWHTVSIWKTTFNKKSDFLKNQPIGLIYELFNLKIQIYYLQGRQ